MRRRKDEQREIPIKFEKSDDEEAPEAAELSGSDQGDSPAREQEPAVELDAASEEQPADLSSKAPQPSTESEEAGDPPPASEVASSDLQVQVDTLTAEKSALYDQLLRRQAEFENYRRRIERERSEVFQRARADVLLEMLPVLDNLERALASLEQSEGDEDALRHGVELIHRQFRDALTKLGLQPVESVGHTFDPHVHEAVTIEPTDEHQENTIIEEFQRGYKVGDRLLRPAKVKVASTPER